ncbi:MAG: GNAT family N-acetyltransferase [Lachnospiraceae bacterium]|nr:GNAT family N-acetyltransferase [Lachnospiraceae bacterium]
MECIKFEQEKKYIRDFLDLPKKIYTKADNMENSGEIESLLTGNHPLSKYFTMHKFLIYKNKKVTGRFVITIYNGDDTAYFGFFECINDKSVATYLFEKATEYVREIGLEKIVGPVDASFWIKYRLKTNLFENRPYTGEPYNKDYYLEMFKDNGFKICHHYTSNIYNKVVSEEPLYDDRYIAFLGKGYEIISPKIEDFDKIVKELYELLTVLYSDFPIYKDVSYEDFAKVFSDYRYIINMSMVKMAYYDGKAVGFFVSVPDYGNKVYHLKNIGNLLKVLRIKKKPRRYVMLYMGVDQEHRGLGKALVGSIMEELRRSGLPSVGALARDGKITQKYGEEHIEECCEYVLLEKSVEND